MPAEPPWTRWLWLVALVPCLAFAGGAVIQHDVWISDLLHNQLPYRAFLGQSLRQGQLPLWMPDLFSGVPFLAQIEAGALYPPHMVLFASLQPFSALNAALTADLLLMAGGAALLARRLGASPAASALAAVVFAWCGFSISHFRHLNMHAAAALLPWMALVLEQLLAGDRRAPARFAGLVGLQLLAGHPQIAWISLLLLGARTLVALSATPQRVRVAGAALGAVALGVGLACVQLLPVAAFTRASLAAVEPTWEYASALPYTWTDLWTWVYPPAVGAMETYDYAGGGNTIPWGNYGYCGLVALLLAPVGLTRDRTRLFWLVAGLVSVGLVLGPLTPLYRVFWEITPGARLFRFPTRFLLPASLAVAVLGALGLTRLTRGRPGVAALVVVVALGDLAWMQRPRIPVDAQGPWAAPSAVATALEPGTERVWAMEEFALWERAFVRSEGFRKGFDAYRATWPVPIGNSGLLAGLRSPSGYTRMVHVRCAAFWQGYNLPLLPEHFTVRRPTAQAPTAPAPFLAQLSRASVRYLLTSFPVEAPQLVLRGQEPLYLWENTAALPRAYVAEGWVRVDDLKGAADWMFRDGLDAPGVPAVEDPEGVLGPASGGRTQWHPVAVTERSPSHLVLDVSDAPAGVLVVTDTWDEGWSVQVDGRAAPLLVANGYQRGVALGPQAREVTFRYWPAGLSAGIGVSCLSLLLLGVLGARGWRTTKTGRRLSSS